MVGQCIVCHCMYMHMSFNCDSGMGESSGPHCLNQMLHDHWRVGSAGKSINGVRTKLDHPDAEGEGEVSS